MGCTAGSGGLTAHATKIYLNAMAVVPRRVTYRLYPSSAQAAEMARVCDLHRALYNAALQERSDAWRLSQTSIGFAAQCKSLTQIRRDDPAYRGLNAQSLQVTLKRLDLAFGHFFRRVRAGDTPGYPRFKSRDRFAGFGFKTHGDGFKFAPGANWRHGTLTLSGIGAMRARGEARTPGQVVCCDIQRKSDGWMLSLVVACEPHRERTGDLVAGLDWGVETLATLCYGPHAFAAIANDRLLAQEQDDIKAAQRELSRHLRGRRSKRAARAKRLLAKRSRRLANRRKDRNHQTTARLARDHAVIVTEDLSVANMTASAKGTAEKPGKNVRQKAGLNRAILDLAPGSWLSILTCKAEEAGGRMILVDPRKHRPSQTDPIDGSVRKKALSERTHVLPDGRVIGRDEASAWVLWSIGQRVLGQELTRAETLETAARAA
jgi:putative transposase